MHIKVFLLEVLQEHLYSRPGASVAEGVEEEDHSTTVLLVLKTGGQLGDNLLLDLLAERWEDMGVLTDTGMYFVGNRKRLAPFNIKCILEYLVYRH